MIQNADWEMLRDELAAKDIAEQKSNWEGLSLLLDLPSEPTSSYMDAKSDQQLADMMEGSYTHLVITGQLTKEMVERYADFFDRTGLETDLDKYINEVRAEWKRKDSYGDTVAPISPAEQRKALCREYRRSIGWQLKEMRTKSGYTLRQVEEATGINKNIISRTEAGRANTTIDTLAVLTDFYGMGPIEMTKISGLPTIDEIG